MPQDNETSHQCVYHVKEEASDSMMIAFAGNAMAFGGIQTFEFLNLMSDVPVNKIFLLDRDGTWYQNGLPGIGKNVREVAEYLKNECALRRANRVVVLGNSAGGFAAILFGALIHADEVYAFSPQTRLLEETYFRNPSSFHRLHRKIKIEESVLDLREILKSEKCLPTKIFIHYPRYEAIDSHHARHLADLPNVRLIGYPYSEHCLVTILKNQAMLKPLLRSAMNGERDQMEATIKQSRSLIARYERSRRRQEFLLSLKTRVRVVRRFL